MIASLRDKHFRRRIRENAEAYAYLAPASLVLLVFWFLPVLLSFVVSFTNYRGGDPIPTKEIWAKVTGHALPEEAPDAMGMEVRKPRFVGLTNYRNALTDAEFRKVLYNTLNYSLYSVPLTLLVSLFVALLINSKIKCVALFRTVYFLPFVTTWVAISIVFRYFFHREFGLANDLLMSAGLPRFDWLEEPRGIFEMFFGQFGLHFHHPLLAGPSFSLFSIILTSIWRDLGYYMIIFLAGLQNIDRSYYEAAEIDGAGKTQQFFRITFPLLSPTTFFLLIISGINAFKVFIPMLIMTPNGGPDGTTNTIVFYLYQKGFTGTWRLGYASAVAYILFLIILILTLIQNRVFGKKVHYD
ncbi:MAG: sugar ABC transporter permease [bacterium]